MSRTRRCSSPTTVTDSRDVDLPAMIEAFKQSGKVACFVAARPNFSLHLVEMDADGK